MKTIISSSTNGAIVGSSFVEIVDSHEDNLVEIIRALEEKTSKLKAKTTKDP